MGRRATLQVKEYGILDSYDTVDLSYSRAGQDVRYALDDFKLRALGWEPQAEFDKELKDIVDYYKSKFIW
jgi:dTDP-D-glucose 4,6-dehydratase